MVRHLDTPYLIELIARSGEITKTVWVTDEDLKAGVVMPAHVWFLLEQRREGSWVVVPAGDGGESYRVAEFDALGIKMYPASFCIRRDKDRQAE